MTGSGKDEYSHAIRTAGLQLGLRLPMGGVPSDPSWCRVSPKASRVSLGPCRLGFPLGRVLFWRHLLHLAWLPCPPQWLTLGQMTWSWWGGEAGEGTCCQAAAEWPGAPGALEGSSSRSMHGRGWRWGEEAGRRPPEQSGTGGPHGQPWVTPQRAFSPTPISAQA